MLLLVSCFAAIGGLIIGLLLFNLGLGEWVVFACGLLGFLAPLYSYVAKMAEQVDVMHSRFMRMADEEEAGKKDRPGN